MMTNEEAIHALDTLVEAYGIAIRALHAQKDSNLVEIDQVKPAKLDRSRWEGCEYCKNMSILKGFCYSCGRPLTEEAWAELERKIGGNDGTTD